MTADPPPARGASTPLGKPSAEGTLEKTPLVHLLVYLLDQALSGTLVLTPPGGAAPSLVYFARGAPAKARLGEAVAPLDRVLAEMKLVADATLVETVGEAVRARVLHGALLVGRGLLSKESLSIALSRQVFRNVSHLFSLPDATGYAFYADRDLLEGYGGAELTPCEPLGLVLAGARLRAGDPRAEGIVAKASARSLRPHPAIDPARFGLTDVELALLEALRAEPQGIAELVAAGIADRSAAVGLVYALAITRHLDLGPGGRPPVAIPDLVPRGAGLPPPSSSASRPSSPGGKPRVPTRTGFGLGFAGRRGPTASSPDLGAPAPPARAVMISSPDLGGARPPPPPPPGRSSRSSSPDLGGARPPPPPPPGRAAMVSSPDLGGARPPPPPPGRAAMVSSPDLGGARPPPPSPSGRGIALSSPELTPPPPSRPAIPAVAPPPSPAVSPERVPSAASEAEDPELAARRAELASRLAALDSADHFAVLGVGRGADPAAVQAAYFALARRFHPDRQPEALGAERRDVARLFARLGEAYQTLEDPSRRAAYVAGLAGHAGGGRPPEESGKVERVVEAALEFQKAEALLKKHDLAGAEAFAHRAAEADPEQPDYRTLLVWIRAQRKGEPPPADEASPSPFYDEFLRELDAVLAKEPRYERALFYRGMLLKRSGRGDRALRDFKLVAELNPKNIDAAREVRIADMRRRASSPDLSKEKPAGGFFGRLFKKG